MIKHFPKAFLHIFGNLTAVWCHINTYEKVRFYTLKHVVLHPVMGVYHDIIKHKSTPFISQKVIISWYLHFISIEIFLNGKSTHFPGMILPHLLSYNIPSVKVLPSVLIIIVSSPSAETVTRQLIGIAIVTKVILRPGFIVIWQHNFTKMIQNS